MPEELREKLARATVYITTELFISNRDWSELPPEITEKYAQRPSEAAAGSGFFVSPEGHIVTNAHVIEGLTFLVQYTSNGPKMTQLPAGSKSISFDRNNPKSPWTLSFSAGTIKVVANSGEKDEKIYAPKVLKVDVAKDLAVLKISPTGPTPSLELLGDDAVQGGAPVLMSGFPGGAVSDIAPFANSQNIDRLMKKNPRVSINAGMVTAIREHQGEKRYQLDIRANHGNSGGPIVDVRGRVLGVLYAGIDSMQSINYAIPASLAKKMLPGAEGEAAAGGEPSRDEAFDAFKKSGEFKFGKKK